LLKNLCLQIPLVDALKMPPYSKYMKDIVTNKRKIPSEAITTMLADYSFEEKMPKKRGDRGNPTDEGMPFRYPRISIPGPAH
jgi:hypothetical protein